MKLTSRFWFHENSIMCNSYCYLELFFFMLLDIMVSLEISIYGLAIFLVGPNSLFDGFKINMGLIIVFIANGLDKLS